MAVSVTKRPEGKYFNPSNVNSGVALNNNGKVNIRKATHGLSDGGVVYVKSDVEDYNGFFYVRLADANLFYIQTFETAYTGNISDCVDYVRETSTLVYYGAAGGSIKWSCVHLPIVYKLSNTLWPTNSADTVRTISSVTDSSGYCALSLSGDIKATGSAAELEFVKVTNATDDDLNGVWQIVSYTNDTTFSIAIPYSSANDTALTGASIQYYYNNYHIKVQVWGGLNNGHVYYSQEPYELLATLNLIPDSNNITTFSISEILKKNVANKNNLLLGSLPNNLDAFTMFFIKYAEVHDDSDGSMLTSTTPSYTSDLSSFEGFAVNSKLAFKNIYSGLMSEYASEDTSQKFLTTFTRPTIFDGKYFDLGILFNADAAADYPLLRKEFYLNSVKQSEEYAAGTASSSGVYRIALDDISCVYDRIDASVFYAASVATPAPSSWTDIATWTSKSATQFNYTDASSPYDNPQSYTIISATSGKPVRIVFAITLSGTYTGTISVSTVITDSSNVNISNEVADTITVAEASSTLTAVLVPTQTNASARLQIIVSPTVGTGSVNLTITIPTYYHVGTAMTETKTIDVNCDCLKAKATGYYLSWLNYLGDFDYWYFTAYADNIIDITEAEETEESIFPDWPNSYGEFADTANRKQTFRNSREQVLVRSQHVTQSQLQAIKHIKTSPLVQIVNSIYDRRTVLVDRDSFTYLKEGSNLYEISFTITYTDDVPSQRV